MTGCAVTTGFFVLAKCGAPAVTGCPQCRRPLCAAHVADLNLCPECAAAYGHGGHPAAAAAGYRRGIRSRIARVYSDRHWYDQLDTYDRAAFEPGAAGNPEFADERDSGLVDS